MKKAIVAMLLLLTMLITVASGGMTVLADEAEDNTNILLVDEKSDDISNSEEIMIKDPTLARAIRLQLGLDNDEVVTVEQMESLEGLLLSYCTITTLDGLEIAKNIHSLSFDHCTINDYTALTKLDKLAYLQINGNSLTNDKTGFVSQLKSVETLDMSYNELTDISFLKDMDSIVSLILSGNKISDLTPITTMDSVQTVYLASNDLTSEQVKALEPKLSGLYELDLDYNKITDVSVFASVNGMTGLYLNSNEINDISPLKDLTSDNIVTLQIKQNALDLTSGNATMEQINKMIENGITVSYSSSMQDQLDRQQQRKEQEKLEAQAQKTAIIKNIIILAVVCVVIFAVIIVIIIVVKKKNKGKSK